MTTYEHRAEVEMSCDELFGVLTDPKSLPRYFPALTEIDQMRGKQIHVVAEVDGRKVESDGWLKVDRPGHTLSWGAPGEDDYHGELTVAERGAGLSEIVITLHTEREGGPEIQRGLEEAVAVLTHRAAGESESEAAQNNDGWY